MGISDKLADLNATRFHDWQPDFTRTTPARRFWRWAMSIPACRQRPLAKPISILPQHLRMLSGLYGVLRPLDLMQPYRLEMGIKLENAKGKDLYQFWGDVITDKLNQALKARATISW
jgi:cytoplasmic iron level regulating protein YaaA (DUF328/UPF0246 family)